MARVRVDPSRGQIVYGHYAPGSEQPFHIGSGTMQRAFSDVRSAEWRRLAARGYEVEILEQHACPARARLREALLIESCQPVTNVHHRNGPHRQVRRGFTKRGLQCDCSAEDCYGRAAALAEMDGGQRSS
jgi:hypothetical protein